MKNLFLAAAFAFSGSAFAQTGVKDKKAAVPAEVKAAFAKDFPSGKAKWEMEHGNFEAEFKMNGTDASAVYDKTGHRTELEMDIKITDLPASAQEYIKINYPKSKIKESAKITDDKNVLTYEAEIGKDGKSYDVLFDENGKFIKIIAGD